MNNYQLYKTNILLTGQVQWDIVIGLKSGMLYVKDFHLVPVSNFVPYNKYSDECLLNYEHRYNIKDLYKKISGYFYSTPVNHDMSTYGPVIDKKTLPYDDSYFAGCKRLNYKIYNKAFGYFCPVWLEKLEESDILSFNIKMSSQNHHIASKTLVLDYLGIPEHDRFVKYFRDYIKYLQIHKGCDDIIKIDLSTQQSYLKGLDVSTGNVNIYDLPKLAPMLISRERPLMEFDSIITNSYQETKSIIPNLFNFNVCFNSNDILTGGISSEVEGESLIYSLDAGLSRKNGNDYFFDSFEKTDIYSNFNYIHRKYSGISYDIDYFGNVHEIFMPSQSDDLGDTGLRLLYTISLNDDGITYHIDAGDEEIVNNQLMVTFGMDSNNNSMVMDTSLTLKGYGIYKLDDGTYFLEAEDDDVSESTWLVNVDEDGKKDGKHYPNVLDYLRDDQYIDFMDKNKVVQSICHWQLVDNNDYIFNLYDGFAGYTYKGNINHYYADTPDTTQGKYSVLLNNTGWANLFNIDYLSYMYIVNNYATLKEKGYISKIGKGWLKNLYYTSEAKPVYVMLGYIKKDEERILSTANKKDCIIYNPKYSKDTVLVNFLGIDSDIIFICSSNKDLLTFAGISRLLGVMVKDDTLLGEAEEANRITGTTYNTKLTISPRRDVVDGSFVWEVISGGRVLDNALNIRESIGIDLGPIEKLNALDAMMKSVKQIPMVVINKSLHIAFADSPSMSTNEVEYYKNDHPNLIYVLRYDGKIKPCFGYGFNELFYKKYMDPNRKENILKLQAELKEDSINPRFTKEMRKLKMDELNEELMNPLIKYADSGYSPLYRSIEYYPYKSVKLNYDKPVVDLSEFPEYKWFNKNRYIHLPGEIELHVAVEEEKNEVNEINIYIKSALMSYFELGAEKVEYIFNRYDISYHLIELENEKLEYKINMSLK